VTLLGDAIHAMLPTLGQGANMALRVAGVLAGELAGGGDVVTAIGRYEQEMRERVYPIMALAADHDRSFGGGALARAREETSA
jgi:2-polyprenyl-6-methoxyphenol hydroxylase-like FAD-dependent oxidoreductase